MADITILGENVKFPDLGDKNWGVPLRNAVQKLASALTEIQGSTARLQGNNVFTGTQTFNEQPKVRVGDADENLALQSDVDTRISTVSTDLTSLLTNIVGIEGTDPQTEFNNAITLTPILQDIIGSGNKKVVEILAGLIEMLNRIVPIGTVKPFLPSVSNNLLATWQSTTSPTANSYWIHNDAGDITSGWYNLIGGAWMRLDGASWMPSEVGTGSWIAGDNLPPSGPLRTQAENQGKLLITPNLTNAFLSTNTNTSNNQLTLNLTHLPRHTHSINDHSHSFSGNTSDNGEHTHSYRYRNITSLRASSSNTGQFSVHEPSSDTTNTTGEAGRHNHSIQGDTDPTTLTIGETGNDTPQPINLLNHLNTVNVNYLVRVK